MEHKICFNCGVEKPLSDYYKHNKMADGYLGKCKHCAREATRINTEKKKLDPLWVEKEKDRCRRKSRRSKSYLTPERKSLYNKRYLLKYPEKKSRKPVEKKSGFHCHHWSYRPEHSKDTILLRIRDHVLAHRFLVYDKDSLMYFDKSGALLDTKEKHERYIVKMISENVF